MKRHLTDSKTHWNSLSKKSEHVTKAHTQILDQIIGLKKAKAKVRDDADDIGMEDESETLTQKKAYLLFLRACYRAKLSFNQIHILAREIKQIYSELSLSFLSKHSFSLDEIGDVARVWRDSLMEQLCNDLEKSKYSICIDNSTISGANMSVLQARYIKEIKTSDDAYTLQIQNRVVGLEYLGEKSTGKAMYEVAKREILDKSPEIRNNLISLTHDHASSLRGISNGLIAHIRKDMRYNYVFDVEDPCHSFNLAIRKSLDILPDEVMDFIEKIHSHFSSLQRRSKLNRIQREENFKELVLCHYVETR